MLSVREEPLPAVAAVVSFIDAINRGDVDRLGDLMTEDHHLDVFDEPPLRGKTANIDAWRGYASAFPAYVIYPHRLAERDDAVAVLGHTTGSHLGLSDDEESKLLLVWKARVEEGRLACWQLLEDAPELREQLGLHSSASPRLAP
jgi:ketosteroid isomerase-like protein